MSDELDREMAERLSKNSSRGFPDIKLAPRSVGSFTVNTCRNALCPSFAIAPVVLQVSQELKTGNIKGGGEGRAYECGQCGQSSVVKSNIALVQEYSRLRTLHRGTKREYCPNDGCNSHRVPQSLMPSAYTIHGKTPKGDPRFQCRDCRRTFSVGSPKRRHKETTETGEIMKLLVNNVPLRRILEITEIPPARLYNRIDFLAAQCRDMAAVKERNLWRGFKDRNRVISTDVQTILANWRHAHRVLNVPIRHAVSVERDTGYAIAATTDFDPDTDPSEVQEAMQAVDDFSFPRAYRQHGRVWAREEYEDSVLRGVQNVLSDEEKMVNLFDIPGEGARVRGDIFQAAHMLLVKKLIGDAFIQVLYAIDGDIGLAKLTSVLNARDVMAGRVHVADVRFKKELGNRKRNKLVQIGDQMMRNDARALVIAAKAAQNAYNLKSDVVTLVAARLLSKYGVTHVDDRGKDLAENGFYWRYHRKEEPKKHIRLLTDRGDLSFGDLAILLTRTSMAPVDKYFALIRRRIKAFDRGSRPVSGETTWYVNAYYDPAMIDKVATIFRFYYNFMLVESAESGKKKEDRQTPAMKIGLTKGKVFMRDLLSFS